MRLRSLRGRHHNTHETRGARPEGAPSPPHTKVHTLLQSGLKLCSCAFCITGNTRPPRFKAAPTDYHPPCLTLRRGYSFPPLLFVPAEVQFDFGGPARRKNMRSATTAKINHIPKTQSSSITTTQQQPMPAHSRPHCGIQTMQPEPLTCTSLHHISTTGSFAGWHWCHIGDALW